MVGESWNIFANRVLVQNTRYHVWKSRGGTPTLTPSSDAYARI